MDIVLRAKQVMGTFELDPASDAFGNSRVGARTYYTELADGLSKPWGSREDPNNVFCNPPGGKRGNQSVALFFWDKLMQELGHGHIKTGIFVAFSIEQLQSSQQAKSPMTAHHVCIPKKRIQFESAQGVKAKNPTHASAIVLVRGRTAPAETVTLFFEAFHTLGAVLMPQMRLAKVAF